MDLKMFKNKIYLYFFLNNIKCLTFLKKIKNLNINH